MNSVTRLMLGQVVGAQEQIHGACDVGDTSCPTDLTYLREWESMRDYIDVTIENIRVALESGDYTDEQLQQVMTSAMNRIVPAGNALRDGYILDIANCPKCGDTPCEMKQRARDYLTVRRALENEQG